MKEREDKEHHYATTISRLTQLVIFLLALVVILIIALVHYAPNYVPNKKTIEIEPDSNGNFTLEAKQKMLEASLDIVDYWIAPEISALEKNANKNLILYGKDLIEHTANYYGENGSIFKSSTNGMNCQNCHLEAGTKIFGNNYSAVASTYPKYRARSGSIETISKRINDCFERSLNGKAIDTSSKEMKAITAYISWLGKGVPKSEKPAGSGLRDLPFLDRAADPNNGKLVYEQKCKSCHQTNGEGLMNADKTAYTYPPLWGKKSYNTGAGLYRLSTFAKFAKCNMPQNATYDHTQLTDEEAWDVAAFVNSQYHPVKDTKADWPKIEEKPVDHPFGPYQDSFDEKQHKYGPFKPIQKKIMALKDSKKATKE
ncbi:MAG: c-type cytochrome [Bacteroidota bacterium]|nr:c-type cytochrome [Bacteroidota bacterium]